MIYKSLKKIDTSFGKLFFKNFNNFSYNLFSYFYKKKICNLNILNDEKIQSFHLKGYAKVEDIKLKSIDSINKIILSQINRKEFIKHEASEEFIITDKIISIIKEILDTDLKEILSNLSKYYNQKIYLTNVMIKRNLPIQDKDHSKEYYNNFFHNDQYTFNMFKIFINLNEISELNGHFTFIDKKFNKEFIKYSNSHRLNLSEQKISNLLEEKLIKNTGSKGSALLCNTTEIIHRASEVKENNKRDMLFLEFAAFPFKDENIVKFQREIIEKKQINKKIAKIIGYKNLYKTFNKFLENKLIK